MLTEWQAMTQEAERRAQQEPCVVCRYSPEPCAVPYVRGTIGRVVQVRDSGGERLELEIIQDGVTRRLQLLPPWDRLLRPISRILRQLEVEEQPHELEVTAYHLAQEEHGRLVAGADSLVVLEPDWLITVTDLTQVEYCPRQVLVDRFRLMDPGLPLVRGNIVHQVFEQLARQPGDQDAATASLKQA